jgi:hypothetical protein
MIFKRLLIVFILFATNALAVRPFITDDARVVGRRLAQYESWLRFDYESWQHWSMVAYGPNSRSEYSLGFVQGLQHPQGDGQAFSYAVPLIQGKFLLREYGHQQPPGIALAAGTFLPGGRGEFKSPGVGVFSFLMLSQCFGEKEDVLIHANFGVNSVIDKRKTDNTLTWGLGTQIRALGGFHFVGEVFSGDPYVPGSGLSYQVGFRHFVSDFVQFDVTVGEGIAGNNRLPFWYSAGIRLVTDWFHKG